jgi:Spy/CpxP family protein refolding chaperone
MNRFTLILATLAASTTVAFAQTPAGGPPDGPPGFGHGRGGSPVEHLTQELSLSEAQAAQVKQIFEAQRSKMEAERAQFEASGTRPTREEMKAHHDQMDAELHQQLAGVLTPDQLTKFDELRKRRPHGPPPGEPGEVPPAQ